MKVSFILLTLLFYANIVLSQNSETIKKNNRAIKSEAQNILNTPSCLELVHYRDKELYQQYTKALDSYTINYKVDKQSLIDLEKNREDLLKGDASWWQMSTKTATTNTALVTAVIAKNIQIKCKLIANILKINPAIGVASKVVEHVSLTVERIYHSLEAGEKISYIVEEGAQKAAAQEVLSIAGPLGQAVKTAWDLAEGIKEMSEIPENSAKLKEEVNRILKMIDNEVKRYQQNINSISSKLNDVNEIKKGIDKYLAEKCRYVSTEKTLTGNKKTTGIESAKSNDAAKTAKKNATEKGYYVFLTTEIFINNKSTNIISNPVPYNGNPNDITTDDKNDFIKEIRKQIPNPQDLKKDQLMQNSYAAIKVHYGKPYSTKLLKTKGDVSDAIEAYKKSLRDATEGLGGDPLEFLQINE